VAQESECQVNSLHRGHKRASNDTACIRASAHSGSSHCKLLHAGASDPSAATARCEREAISNTFMTGQNPAARSRPHGRQPLKGATPVCHLRGKGSERRGHVGQRFDPTNYLIFDRNGTVGTIQIAHGPCPLRRSSAPVRRAHHSAVVRIGLLSISSRIGM